MQINNSQHVQKRSSISKRSGIPALYRALLIAFLTSVRVQRIGHFDSSA